jgi:CSLREA domain-containing protein
MNKMNNVITITGNDFSVEFESSETSDANKDETAALNRLFAKTKQAAFVFGSVFSVLSLFLLLSLTSLETKAATFTVDTKNDRFDLYVGDGVCNTERYFEPKCTLRAAIQEANFSPDVDDITFAPNLDRGFSLDGAIDVTSELRITSSMNISGSGARAVTVSAVGRNNVFYILQDVQNPVGSLIVNISGITVSHGNSNAGGGISIHDGTVTLTEVVVKNNVAYYFGGGIYNSGGTLNLVRSTVSNNSARNGGGIYNESGGTTNIVNSTVSDNTATNRNSEDASGGGGILNTGSMTLVNSTVSNNTAGSSKGGGIALVFQQTATFINTIVAANQSPNGPDVYGPANSLGNNLIGTFHGNNGFDAHGDKVSDFGELLNPRLGALQNNGGQTDTRSLLAGSPALNAGNSCVTQSCWETPLNTDQRGLPRKSGASVDIGAFEAPMLGITPPVSVGGRILLPNNRGLHNAKIVMTNASGEARYAIPDALGQYRFDGVRAGETYIFEVRNMRNVFPPQTVFVNADRTDLDFVSTAGNGVK